MTSFIVPAHNEELWVDHCVTAIHEAMKSLGADYEIVVVNDASTDGTARVAQERGARVLQVECRHISAARNHGARAARGEILFFVDADTLVNAAAVQAAFRVLNDGAIGGGCEPRYDGVLPLWFKLVWPLFVLAMRAFRQPGGSCLFCTRTAFGSTGGFSEIHYAAEDAVFVIELKRCGRFAMLRETVVTSGRNFRAHSFWSYARLAMRFFRHGTKGFGDRTGLDIWYRPLRKRGESR